jgi:hypothetical protein
VQSPARVTKMWHPNLDLCHPPPSLASEAQDAEAAGGEEYQS